MSTAALDDIVVTDGVRKARKRKKTDTGDSKNVKPLRKKVRTLVSSSSPTTMGITTNDDWILRVNGKELSGTGSLEIEPLQGPLNISVGISGNVDQIITTGVGGTYTIKAKKMTGNVVIPGLNNRVTIKTKKRTGTTQNMGMANRVFTTDL